MLCRDVVREIAKYATRKSLLMLLSTCKEYNQYDDVYFELYSLRTGKKQYKWDKWMNVSFHTSFQKKCTIGTFL